MKKIKPVSQWNTHQNRVTVVFLILFAVGIVLREYTNAEGSMNYLNGIVQTTLWTGVVIMWGIYVRHRVIQTGIRRFITAICAFLVLWFLLRGLKYYVFQPETTAARYCWYAYYIPMMFYPTCAVFAMVHIGKRDDWVIPRRRYILFFVPALISFLVLTNDLHQHVFAFPENAAVWSDVDYSYGIFYAFPYIWFLICMHFTFFRMVRRCRIPQSHRLLARAPMIPSFLGLLYTVLYAMGYASFFSDLIIVMCILTIVTFELSIRLGYIRSNTNYLDLFHRSSVAAQIYDEDHRLQYVSGEGRPYDSEIVENAIEHGSVVQGNLRYVSKPIRGGYAVWQEDVTELVRLHKELESANEYLDDKNIVLRQNYEAKIKRRMLEEQNILYNEMQNQTKEKLFKIEQYLAAFEEEKGGKEISHLRDLGVMIAYLKRRNNLIFLAKDNRKIPTSEIRNCINETAKVLDAFGNNCVLHMGVNDRMSFERTVSLYDAFEDIIEKTLRNDVHYFASLTKEDMIFVLRIRICGLESLPEEFCTRYAGSKQEDGDYLSEVRV